MVIEIFYARGTEATEDNEPWERETNKIGSTIACLTAWGERVR